MCPPPTHMKCVPIESQKQSYRINPTKTQKLY